MSAPTGTTTTLVSIGNREDLEDVIYRVAPEETPFSSNIGKSKVKAIFHEWQTETLAAADATNAQLEGDDVGTLDNPNLTTRLGNYSQIFRKTGGVSGTEEVVDKAGRDSEMNRQKVLKGIEMKRDAEKRFIGNYASVVESGATTRKSAGILAFLTSNTSKGSGGTDGGYSAGIVSAAGNGTQRTFTEALIKSVRATAFANGGKATQAYMGGTHKQQFSAFTGIAETRVEVRNQDQATIIAAADVYVDDFGKLVLIPHAYGLTRDCVLIDPDMAAIGTLRGATSEMLGKSGDSDKFMLIQEKCLVVKNEKSHAVIRDLT